MKRIFTTADVGIIESDRDCELQNTNCKLEIEDSAIDNLQFAICILQSVLRVLCVLCGYSLCFTVGASAAEHEVVSLAGEPFVGELASIGPDGRFVFQVQGRLTGATSTQRALRLDELVRWGHPREPRPQILVVLADGGRLLTAAAWSGGAPLRLENENLIVKADTWGEVSLARSLVRGMVFAQRNHAEERERLEKLVREEPSPSPSRGERENVGADLVLLTNKDRVTGSLTVLGGGSLTLETASGAVKLPLSRVEAVVFGNNRQTSAVRSQPKVVVGLRDGSLVYAESLVGAEKKFTLQLTENLTLTGEVSDIDFVQSLGGQFGYLSDLEPEGYRHVPYLTIEWPYTRDCSVLGEPLSAGGRRYLKGVGMHSAARLTHRLDGEYQRFDAAVAIDDSAGKRGSATFGVYVQRNGTWSEAFTSGIVRGGEAPRLVSVDVAGARGLTLTVDYADRGDEMDRANWLDARLVR